MINYVYIYIVYLYVIYPESKGWGFWIRDRSAIYNSSSFSVVLLSKVFVTCGHPQSSLSVTLWNINKWLWKWRICKSLLGNSPSLASKAWLSFNHPLTQIASDFDRKALALQKCENTHETIISKTDIFFCFHILFGTSGILGFRIIFIE